MKLRVAEARERLRLLHVRWSTVGSLALADAFLGILRVRVLRSTLAEEGIRGSSLPEQHWLTSVEAEAASAKAKLLLLRGLFGVLIIVFILPGADREHRSREQGAARNFRLSRYL